ncbi:MAG: dTMP kinase, partial [Rhodanobacteraceae bacterium]
TLLVDVSVETSRSRIAARSERFDRLESADLAFHRRVRDGFLDLARSDSRIVVLDGERAPGTVLDAALTHVANLPR